MIARACPCSTSHNPKPLELVPYFRLPLEVGGLDVPENRVMLCPTAHANTTAMFRAMLRVGVLTQDECRRSFGEPINRYCYDLATRSLETFTKVSPVADGWKPTP